jgi:hypothetical protein
MHINYEEVDVLVKEFEKIHGRELIVEDMSQFHVDFYMNGVKDDI